MYYSLKFYLSGSTALLASWIAKAKRHITVIALFNSEDTFQLLLSVLIKTNELTSSFACFKISVETRVVMFHPTYW